MINQYQGVDPNQAIQQFASKVGNPQRLVELYFSDVPMQYRGTPEGIINYLMGVGKLSQQQVNVIQDYISRNGIK